MLKRIFDWITTHKLWSALIALCALLVWPVIQQVYLDTVAPPVERWLEEHAGPLIGPFMSFVVANAVSLIGVAGLIVVGLFIGRETTAPSKDSSDEESWTETRLRVRRDPSGSGSFLQVMCVNVNGWQQTFSKISHRDAEGKPLSEIQHDNIAIAFERPFSHSRPIVDVFGHKLPAYQYFPVGTRGALFMFTDAIDAPIMDIWFPPPDYYEKAGSAASSESPANLSANRTHAADVPRKLAAIDGIVAWLDGDALSLVQDALKVKNEESKAGDVMEFEARLRDLHKRFFGVARRAHEFRGSVPEYPDVGAALPDFPNKEPLPNLTDLFAYAVRSGDGALRQHHASAWWSWVEAYNVWRASAKDRLIGLRRRLST